ncbi:hypothetical protein D3C80_1466820 [compost metagenome]
MNLGPVRRIFHCIADQVIQYLPHPVGVRHSDDMFLRKIQPDEMMSAVIAPFLHGLGDQIPQIQRNQVIGLPARLHTLQIKEIIHQPG